jgi:hypothetical protein
VLIREDHIPRLSWPMGVIVQLFPGKDGLVRSVNLKTASGVITKSIQRLHDIEICAQSVFDPSESVSGPVDTSSVIGNLEEHIDDTETLGQEVPSETNEPSPVSKATRLGRVVKARDVLDL